LSLEDNAEKPEDILEIGEPLCIVSPGLINDITPTLHIATRGRQREGYYIQVIAADALKKPPEPAHMIIWLVPISRSKELVPE